MLNAAGHGPGQEGIGVARGADLRGGESCAGRGEHLRRGHDLQMVAELVSQTENLSLFGLDMPLLQKLLDVAHGTTEEKKE